MSNESNFIELQPNEATKNYDIIVNRPAWSEEQFILSFPPLDKEELSCYECLKRRMRALCHQCNANTITKCLPIIEWLPRYHPSKDAVPDVCGGLTVGVMHIPQGLAFAMLASLPPVTGLYTALLPVFIYMLMGTSRYLSQGSFAVICLMVAQVVEREVSGMSQSASINATHVTYNISNTNDDTPWSSLDSKKIEIAVSLALLIGLMQVSMGIARLGFVANFLSDPVISGFTTGSAVLVVISQIENILGLDAPQITDIFGSIKSVIFIFKNITSTNIGSLITGVLCLVILLGIKYLNERFYKRLIVPIPGELLVVVCSTAVSYGFSLKSSFQVQILGTIPKGLPPISIPSFNLMGNIVGDAFVISIVIFATNISLSKMFAKKNKQKIDANQELIAYGACNIGASFFSGFPICNAMARTAVQENLAHTQLCSIVVVGLILLVLMFLTKLFYHLPKAVLASIIVANLTGILKQFSRIKSLWNMCNADCITWIVTCFGVILLGVANGLGSGILVAVLTLLLRSSRPNYSLLGTVSQGDIYKDIKEYSVAQEVSGIKILRYEAPLYYGNAEHFKDVIEQIISQPAGNTHAQEEDIIHNPSATVLNGAGIDTSKEIRSHQESPPVTRTVIIDASTFTNIDSMGILTLSSVVQEYQRQEIKICLANCSAHLRDSLSSVKRGIDRGSMFLSIHDAVISCRQNELQRDREPCTTTL